MNPDILLHQQEIMLKENNQNQEPRKQISAPSLFLIDHRRSHIPTRQVRRFPLPIPSFGQKKILIAQLWGKIQFSSVIGWPGCEETSNASCTDSAESHALGRAEEYCSWSSCCNQERAAKCPRQNSRIPLFQRMSVYAECINQIWHPKQQTKLKENEKNAIYNWEK